MKRILLVLVALLAIGLGGFSQKPQFSTDKNQFLEELGAYLAAAPSKDEKATANAVMNDFDGVWRSRYGEQESEKAIGLCNLMLNRSGSRAYYQILMLTEILLRAPQQGMSGKDMDRWLSYTFNRFSKQPTGLEKYLKSNKDLFTDCILNDGGALHWVARNARFSFLSDTACVFEVSQCDLALVSSKDESAIHGTKGLFDMVNQQWIGKGGRVDWSRFNIPSDKVYGVVDDYQLNLVGSNYHIDAIEFYNKNYFERPCVCSFEDVVTPAAPNEKTLYPQAVPNAGGHEHCKFFGDIEYLGGFGMTGNSMTLLGSKEEPAQIVFNHNNRMTLRIRSSRFDMTGNSLLSNQTSARVYLYDTLNHTVDSVYHNDLGFRFDNVKNRVVLYRKDHGVGSGPFHDTYHGYDIFLEALYWDRGDTEMDFRRLDSPSGDSEGMLSSKNYFNKDEYLKIQALDMKHPMENLNKYLKVYADEHNRFDVNDYVAYVKHPLSQVLSLMVALQSKGYLEYDPETKMVTVLDRFFDVLASEHQTFDFDVIKFRTKVGHLQSNIRLVLGSNDMLVHGVREVEADSNIPAIALSGHKQVVVIPDNARVVLKKNGDFEFSGGIMAGMYEFFTKDCLFNYSKFTIEMNKVDSLRFYARFNDQVYPVEGSLERLSGTLAIDEPDNKSSSRETPDYPKYHCPGYSYKFYRDINAGTFDLELPFDSLTDEDLAGEFYYRLDPFSMDSLENLNSKDVMFHGHLVTGGIFPDIEQPLVVMDDHSLGFDHQVKDGGSGYPVYGGKGRFLQGLHLANDGFYGEGKLMVESSEFFSPRFDFYHDSVVAAVQSFTMAETNTGAYYPKASSGPVDLMWDVTIPQLYTYTKEEPICLYDSTFFHGKTKLTSEGYQGDGYITFGNSRFDSKHFSFNSHSFVADSSDFVLYDKGSANKAFMADNYRLNVDVANKKVKYEYVDSHSNLGFPLNQFHCSLNEAEWDMAANKVHLSSPASSLADSRFVSLSPKSDSLSFNSTTADYDLNDNVIRAHEVKNLFVADAEIIPWNGIVEINSDGEISPLEHATIVVDRETKMHHYKDAEVSIHSRNDYLASGVKDYVNGSGAATPLFFEKIAPVNGVTEAHAEVDESMDFMLSPFFGFKGDVNSSANEQYDRFDGDFRMARLCLDEKAWFASSATIDPKSVEIPVKVRNLRAEQPALFNGLSDIAAVSLSDGDLVYDYGKRSYLFRDKEHADYRYELSDRCVATIHTASNLGFAEGGTHFACYGDFVGYPNDSVTLDIMNVFDVPVFNDQILKEIAEVYASAEGAAVDLTKTKYIDYLRSEKGDGEADKLRQDVELTGYPKIESGDFYNNTIVIPSLKMVWNPELRAYISVGKIGLGSLGKHVVNRYVDGFVMFDKRHSDITYFFKNGDFMTYFCYNTVLGTLQVHATYGTINNQLSDMKTSSRSTGSGSSSFEYGVTTYEALTGFLSKLKHHGIR